MKESLGLPRINGRRGAYLLVSAPVYLVVGLSFFAPQTNTVTRRAALQWLEETGVPIQPFAALWIIAALVAIVCAFQSRPRDWFGFAALTFAGSVWGALFIIGAFTGAPAVGFVSAAVYWLFAALPMVVSGMMGETDRDHRKVKF